MDDESKNRLEKEWQERFREDTERFGPIHIGHLFSFFSTDGKRAIRGTITGIEYGDDGLPFVQVSNRLFVGGNLISFYPSQMKKNEWVAIVKFSDGAREDVHGILVVER